MRPPNSVSTEKGDTAGRLRVAASVLQGPFAGGILRQAFGFSCNAIDADVNAALAAVVGKAAGGPRVGLDVALLKRALGRPDDSDEAILIRLADVATMATISENLALLSTHEPDATLHRAEAAACRRRAGIPAVVCQPLD